MKKLNELKQTELKILKEFDRVCQENKLTYYLAYGTLLGAVRHQGFIPWDDDIDIMMPLEDYLKLRKNFSKTFSRDYYYQDKLNDKYYNNFWAKIGLENTTFMPRENKIIRKYGINIDIFPIFKVNNRQTFNKYFKLLLVTSSKYHVIENKSKYQKYKVLIHRIIPNFINNILYKYALKKLVNKSDNYQEYGMRFISKDKNIFIRKKDIEGNKRLLFEDQKFPVPNNYDKYLKTYYNNYMQIPKESERYNHDKDNNCIYDYHNSYMKYIRGEINDQS